MRNCKTSEDDDIAGFWRDAARLAPLPEYLYQAQKGFGIRTMVLWRLKCHGEVGNRPMFKGGGMGWCAEKDVVLWSGPEYKPHASEVPGKRFSYSKKNLDVTLEDAMSRLHAFAAEYEHELELSLVMLGKEELRLREQKNCLATRVVEAANFSLSVKDLKV